MWQIPQQLGSTPIQVVWLHTGGVAFARNGSFPTHIDQSPKGEVRAIITTENLLVGSQELLYNRSYPLTENIREWLKSFNMLSPV